MDVQIQWNPNICNVFLYAVGVIGTLTRARFFCVANGSPPVYEVPMIAR